MYTYIHIHIHLSIYLSLSLSLFHDFASPPAEVFTPKGRSCPQSRWPERDSERMHYSTIVCHIIVLLLYRCIV